MNAKFLMSGHTFENKPVFDAPALLLLVMPGSSQSARIAWSAMTVTFNADDQNDKLNTFYIPSLATLPFAQRHGLAAALLYTLACHLVKLGFSPAKTYLCLNNQSPHPQMYRELGFTHNRAGFQNMKGSADFYVGSVETVLVANESNKQRLDFALKSLPADAIQIIDTSEILRKKFPTPACTDSKFCVQKTMNMGKSLVATSHIATGHVEELLIGGPVMPTPKDVEASKTATEYAFDVPADSKQATNTSPAWCRCRTVARPSQQPDAVL
jgi:GNAT superfamily N-acetyltransferase